MRLWNFITVILCFVGGWSSAITNFSIDVLVRSCKDLESLGLSFCQKMTSQNLKTITESLENLKKLDLSSISVRIYFICKSSCEKMDLKTSIFVDNVQHKNGRISNCDNRGC